MASEKKTGLGGRIITRLGGRNEYGNFMSRNDFSGSQNGEGRMNTLQSELTAFGSYAFN